MPNQNIPKKILHWYDNNKRTLPWRKKVSKSKREYFTLISEFMLQQTQVKTVVPYFENFVKNFPNLQSLAKSSDQKILKNWEGLGYYSRARNLKKTAILLLKEFNGKLPKEIEKLKSLPGIGEYTSRSILAIAHNKPYIPMDGNVERILKRVFLLKTNNEISKENLSKKKSFFGFSKRSSDYAQAIMEIGALICKPSLPSCIHCPLIENCKAFRRKDFIINSKSKFSKTKYFQANVSKYKKSIQKKINIKMSNMNMKIIINKNTKINKTNNSIFLNKKNINKYILPSFTKKIFNSVS